MRRPTSVEPVNATLSTSGCCASSSPALPPGPVMRLTTPGGMSASSHRLHHLDRAERREARGLQHDGVAGRDRGPDLPARHEEREVPRHDAAAHAERLAAHDALRGRERALAALDDVGLVLRAVGERLERRDRAGDVGEHRLLDRAAAVARFDLGDLRAAAVDDLGDLRAASRRAPCPTSSATGPSSNALRGGFDGALRVFASGLGDVGDLLAGRRCVGREGLARLRVDPGTIDEQLRVAHRDSSQAGQVCVPVRLRAR